MNIKTEECTLCKQQKPLHHYEKVIKRLTYAPDCDENGYEYYLKKCKTCIQCRDILLERANRHKLKKEVKIKDAFNYCDNM
jgi:hypothetical protein